MELGIVGKPNVGKSTFFNASTLSNVEVGNYPFTTVGYNKAIATVRSHCPCSDMNLICNPKNSICISHNRFIPLEIIDVAGLVPKSHEGFGLGNQFLDEIRRARVLIHVVDLSGGTDEEGKSIAIGTHNPLNDVNFLEEEIELWFLNIFKRNWDKIARKVQFEGMDFIKYFSDMYSGLGFTKSDISFAIQDSGVNPKKPKEWDSEELISFSRTLRKYSKPIIIAANKADVKDSIENIKIMQKKLSFPVIPTSSMGEFVLRQLSKNGAIEYIPGDSDFKIVDKAKINSKQNKALDIIKDVLDRYGSTGVQNCINTAVFNILGKIPVYPVEDENKYADKYGNVLPDAYLMNPGSNPKHLAFKIHTDIGKRFIGAIDAKTKIKIKSDKELEKNSIIRILTKK
jgi:ribosome-binding ATPase YchF (GTP1/OBG family)|tara:strand:+ start:247 stop:1443 length:1197 start_codon:yes stop_codon:yes gene_type:complete